MKVTGGPPRPTTRASTATWSSSSRDLREDNNLRRDTSRESLAKLKPAFPIEGSGTLTAGNSTPMTDGASAVLLASEEWARARGLPVLAYLSYGKVAAVNFVNDEGLLMAPAYAVPRMLQDAGIGLQDFDFYEIHEAFAAQVLCTLQAWQSAEFCRDRLGLAAPLGAIDRDEAQREGQQPGGGAPVRRHRRADPGDAREADRPARRRPGPDFGLHGRGHGRHRDRREVTPYNPRPSPSSRIASCTSAVRSSSSFCALASIGATPMKSQAADVSAETSAPDAGQQLHAMLERYFEELLQLNPLLATFIGDPRYNDRLPNSIGPEHRAQVRAMNERYPRRGTCDRRRDAFARRPHFARDLRARARADARGRALSRPPAAGQPDGRPDHADAGARFRHQCAAVRDDPGLRELAAAPRWTGRPGWTRRSSTCAKASPRASCSRGRSWRRCCRNSRR